MTFRNTIDFIVFLELYVEHKSFASSTIDNNAHVNSPLSYCSFIVINRWSWNNTAYQISAQTCLGNIFDIGHLWFVLFPLLATYKHDDQFCFSL